MPGFRLIIPFVETIQVVDIRVITINMQEVMTEDNVPCSIDGVVGFKVNDPEKAILKLKNLILTTQPATSVLRDVER
jgi:regulator of protease activity HflC (stomatin/prohibitin superfamily)